MIHHFAKCSAMSLLLDSEAQFRSRAREVGLTELVVDDLIAAEAGLAEHQLLQRAMLSADWPLKLRRFWWRAYGR